MSIGRNAGLGAAVFAVVVSLTGQARAQLEGSIETEGEVAPQARLIPSFFPLKPVFDPKPGWAIGLEAYGGFAMTSTKEGATANALVGGLSRFRLGYFELGGVLEVSDNADNHWRSVGGFVGAFVPYRHWVDFEFAVGAAARTYRDANLRYGPDGFESTLPALTLRAAVSDRTSSELFGIRLGGQLLAAVDLRRDKPPWAYDVETSAGDVRHLQGESSVGGVTIGLAVTAGFDIGRKPEVPRDPRTFSASR